MAILVFSPNGTHVTKPTLEAARTSADCTGKTVVVTSALTAAQSDITAAWPTDRALEVKKGGSIANTLVFTINSTFSAGGYQAFAGAGTVVFGSSSVTEIRPIWFKGAETDDSISINKALKSAMTDGSGCALVLLDSRTYTINNPIEIWKWSGTAFGWAMVTLACKSATYAELSPGAYITATFKDRPAIMIERGRAVVIENISLQGQTTRATMATLQTIIDLRTDWTEAGTIRTAQYSPYAGICIDPFGTSLPPDGGYPGYSSYYCASAGGSSACKILSTSMRDFHVGLMITPNGQTGNAENISICDCNFNYCKYFIAIGGAQSRNVEVRNFSGYSGYRAFDGTTFGQTIGNSPVVYAANLGKLAEIYSQSGWNHGQEGMLYIYAEELYSINTQGSTPMGYSNFNFDGNCLNRASILGLSGAYKSCSFSYANNLANCLPFAGYSIFTDCTFDSLPIGETGANSNRSIFIGCHAGGARLLNPVTTDMDMFAYFSNLPRTTFLSGSRVVDKSLPGDFRLKVQPYSADLALGTVTTTVDAVAGTASFTLADPSTLMVGDRITYYRAPGDFTPFQYLGTVISIVGTTVNLNYVPMTVSVTATGGMITNVSASIGIVVTRYKKYHYYTIGDTATGSLVVNNVNVPGSWGVGDAVTGAGIPAGAYVTAVGATSLTLSTAATATAVGVNLYDLGVTFEGSCSSVPYFGNWVKGTVIKNSSPAVGSPTGWVCTVGGSQGTWVALANL